MKRTFTTNFVLLITTQILFSSSILYLNKISSHSDLTLVVRPYFRGRTVLRIIHQQDKKTRVKLIQGSPVAEGILPEVADQWRHLTTHQYSAEYRVSV